MYKIKFVHKDSLTTEYLLYEPGNRKYRIASGSLHLEMGKSGELKLTIPNSNPARSELQCLTDEIIVYRDDKEIFRGRAITDQQDFYLTGAIQCEGILSYLYDTYYPPYEYQGSPNEFLQMVINNHNSLVSDPKRFTIGKITVEDPNDYFYRKSSSYNRTIDILSEKFVGESLGGYFRARVAGTNRYLDYLKNYGTTAEQPIKFGSNLLDLAIDVNYSELATAILPLGAADEETQEKLTVASVNGGDIYVRDTIAIEKYGFIAVCVEWDDVTIASNLLTKAKKCLAQSLTAIKNFTIKAVDLALISDAYKHLSIGDSVLIDSEPHGINQWIELYSHDMDILNPANDTFTFGAESSSNSLSGQISSSNRNFQESLSELAVAFNRVTATYVTAEYVSANYVLTKDLDTEVANIGYAKVKDLDANYVKTKEFETETAKLNEAIMQKADIGALSAITGDIETLHSKDAEIDKALITKLDVASANMKYVLIDFTNIGVADIGKFFAKSGIIKDVITETGTVTGELVGVTIRGDRIIGNTIIADKLVIKGEDGLFYKLNTDGEHVESEQTEYNALDGKNIIAKSITATKINVSDLVAFGATIAGLIIENGSIHSDTKTTVDSAMPGIYMDSKGQFNTGDANNFIASWYDTEAEKWKVVIQSDQIMLGNGQSVTEIVTGAAAKVDNMQQRMDSGEFKGADGVSPTVTTSKSNGVTTIKIADANGEKTATINDGATGTSATTYSLIVSHAAIVKSESGTYNPTTITLTAKSQSGSATMANYSGRFKIETTKDNSTWTAAYTSSKNEATKSYTVPADIVAIRCSLYLAGGTTTLLDQQTVPIVNDGAKGNTGDDAYTVILTNESHTFAGGTSAAVAANIDVGVIAYKGATQVTATIGTISGQPDGMTVTLKNNGKTTAAFNVAVTTSMKTVSGVLKVPVTVDGKTFTKEFTYSLAKTGATGSRGATWYAGTAITGTSTTAAVFSGSGVSSAIVGDHYLNTSIQNVYVCKKAGNASTATWAYEQNIKGTTGTPGSPGADGKTTYFHVKYSNDGGKTFTGNSGEDVGDYIGTYTDTTQADSTSVSKYTWAKIKGETGERGTDGAAGVSATGLAWRVNASTFTNTNAGECYYHGFNSKNEAADVDGWVYWNGQKVTIPKGCQVNPDAIAPYGITIYSVFRTSNSTFYAVWWVESENKWYGSVNATGKAAAAKAAWTWNEATDIVLAMYVEPSSEGSIVNAQLFNPPKKYSELVEVARIEAKNAQSDIDNLEIGGRNLLLDSNAPSLTKIASSQGRYWVNGGTAQTEGKCVFIAVTDHPINGITNGIRCTCEKVSTKRYGVGFYAGDHVASPLLENGHVYTASVYARQTANSDTKESVIFTYGANSDAPYLDAQELTTEWKQYSWTFTADTSTTRFKNGRSTMKYMCTYTTVGNVVEMCGFKLEKGNRATDWTPAPEDVEAGIAATQAYAESIQTQLDGMVEIWYGTAVPTTSNAPASTWTTTDAKDLHVDDLYYNTSTGYCYRYTKSGTSYSWTRIKDSDITSANTLASTANTTANSKRRVFTTTPTVPYDVGDLWVGGSNGDIKMCKTAKTSSGSYAASDWVLASKYTDDTAAKTAQTMAKDAPGDNLIPYPYYRQEVSGSSYTSNGITWTLNKDGSVTANGTATANSWYHFAVNYDANYASGQYEIASGGTYTLSGCPSGGSTSKYLLNITMYDGANSSAAIIFRWSDTGNGITFDVTALGYARIQACVYSGQTVSNLTFYPMFEKGSTAHTYIHPKQCGVSLSIGVDAAQADVDALKPELIVGTHGTTATATWTGKSTRLTSLTSGTKIQYKLTSAGASNVTLNLTLANGTTTGAKEVYYSNTTRLATQYPVGAVIDLVYDGTAWRVANPYTNNNTYDRTRYNGAVKASAAIVKANIIVGNASGYHHLKTGGAFDINYPILYANSAIASGATGTDNYIVMPVAIATTQSLTLTAYKALYIKGTLSGPTFTPVSTTPITQAVPTTADGYYYMLLGNAYSTTNFYLTSEHPIYRYLNGKFQQMGSTADEIVLTWSKDKNLTYIDGSHLYTGSVTADKISVSDLSALKAKIGGFSIESTYLSYGIWGNSGATFLLCPGGSASAKAIGGSDSISGWALTISNMFGVTKNGALYSKSGTFTEGTFKDITLTGGINLNSDSSSITSENYLKSTGDLWITTGGVTPGNNMFYDAVLATSSQYVSMLKNHGVRIEGNVISSSKDINFTAVHETINAGTSEASGAAIGFGIGSGGFNRGIIDFKAYADTTGNQWIFHVDESKRAYVKGIRLDAADVTTTGTNGFGVRRYGKVVELFAYGITVANKGTIPAGYRPPTNKSVPCWVGTSGNFYHGWVQITSAGAIEVKHDGGTTSPTNYLVYFTTSYIIN